jgi:hypothetical protein
MRLILLTLLPLSLCAGAAPARDWGDDDRDPGIAGVADGTATRWAARGFDDVAFGGEAQFTVRVGPAWSVSATGPAAAIAAMRVRLRGDSLVIGPRPPYREDSAGLQHQVHFTVTLPRLEKVALGGAGRATVDRVEGDALSVAVGGSGSLTLDRVAVGSAAVSIGGAGRVSAAGTARDLTVNIGGSGSFDSPALRAQTATVSTAGSGTVRTNVDGHAMVSAVGHARVDLGAKAHCQVSRLGSSEVHCGG